MNWMARTLGLRVGLLGSVFPDFYPPIPSVLAAWYKPPRVEPTRWVAHLLRRF